jgi:hypothetical protein
MRSWEPWRTGSTRRRRATVERRHLGAGGIGKTRLMDRPCARAGHPRAGGARRGARARGHARRRLRRPGGPSDDRSFVSEDSRPDSGQGSRSGADVAALTRSPGFWLLMRYAALFGVVLAFAALAFLGLVKGGTNLWFTLPKNPGWLDGSLWWVAVTTAAGGAGRCAAALVSASGQAARHGPGARGSACRAVHGLEGGCRLGGVVGGWREPRAGGRAGEVGGRAGNVGLGAKEAQRRRASDEHAVMEMVVVKWACVIAGAGGLWRGGSGGGPRCGCATRGQAVMRGFGWPQDRVSSRGSLSKVGRGRFCGCR